jgi:hypothetical protein
LNTSRNSPRPFVFLNTYIVDAHQILIACQHGFRARRSCETQLLTLAHELLPSLDVGYQHDLTILDFSKAFDPVPHERLLKKLDHYGIGDSTQGWMKAFLSDRTQQVIVEGATSDTVPVIRPANLWICYGGS